MERYSDERPAVLDDLTTTQLDELLRQYDEGDRASFDEHAESYGWDRATGDAVWNWFASTGPERLAGPVGP